MLGNVSTRQVRLQIAVLGALAYNPRPWTTTSSVCAQKTQLWVCLLFFFLTFIMLFVSPCESQVFLTSGEGGGSLVRPPGVQEFQDLLLFLSKLPLALLCLQTDVEPRQCPGKLEAGQRLSCFWSLNKTSSILISITHPHSVFFFPLIFRSSQGNQTTLTHAHEDSKTWALP